MLGMGLNGFEPLTSSLSVTRSNQLSYKPVFFLPAVHAFRTPKEFLIFAFHGRNVKRSGKVKSSPSCRIRCRLRHVKHLRQVHSSGAAVRVRRHDVRHINPPLSADGSLSNGIPSFFTFNFRVGK